MTLADPAYDGHFVMIPLTHGKFTIVDEADAERVLDAGPWNANPNGCTWYAVRSSCRHPQRGVSSMHALLTGYKMTDHVNRNGLDNRRINLRPATWTQNMANRGPFRNNTSGYKGVSWDRSAGKWVAKIGINGSSERLGYFADPVDAARVYNCAALEAWGEYAWLNPV